MFFKRVKNEIDNMSKDDIKLLSALAAAFLVSIVITMLTHQTPYSQFDFAVWGSSCYFLMGLAGRTFDTSSGLNKDKHPLVQLD